MASSVDDTSANGDNAINNSNKDDINVVQTSLSNWSVLRTAHLANALALSYLVYIQHNDGRILFDLFDAWDSLSEMNAHNGGNISNGTYTVEPSELAVILGRAINLQLMFSALVIYYGVFCDSDITRRWVSLYSLISTFSTAKFLYTTVIAIAWSKGRGQSPVVSATQDIAKNLILLTFANFTAMAYDVFMTRLEQSSLKRDGLILFMKGDRLKNEERRRALEAAGSTGDDSVTSSIRYHAEEVGIAKSSEMKKLD
ncbi:hypothetical protein SARC_12320 [Sphaeroforma arctica JP610]|uniref:Uncharacterized protein n=1 Tax=Sphaeroforma arctica JP610 TaxID=667725 RepID=A0A0L0FGI9_9EUKA|nr:hypothetical protein SARC_12320 [Sphaeroforma arctica JP610]KNC75148.1 hypothetical protein SARC_12320 [Sphaeroforma arctica JP610]|eukprot:XP_014149050.1 hypothetical protein SARC_12320 [Sphaeroforma arctica JP610]